MFKKFLKYKYRYLKVVGILGLVIGLSVPVLSSLPDTDAAMDSREYTLLVRMMKEGGKKKPLYPFNEFQATPVVDEQEENIAFLQNDTKLLSKIRRDLNGGQIAWSLDGYKQRLLFVPEDRRTYEKLYRTYCVKLVDYILAKTGLPNPYSKIINLDKEHPEIPEQGITVFLVNNLAEESVSKYVFTSNASKKSSVLKLRDKAFVGRVGSYSSHLYVRDDGSLSFIKDRYTIWQNNAKNVYTALMVPAEETMHISLRPFTEAAIRQEIEKNNIRSMREIRRIVADWLAIEEGVVGGVVHDVVPSFVQQCGGSAELQDGIVRDLKVKNTYKKYRYLEHGVHLVQHQGVDRVIELYRHHIGRIRQIVAGSEPGEQMLASN